MNATSSTAQAGDLSVLIAARKGAISDFVGRIKDVDSSEPRVLLRQHSLLSDLEEAIAAGVTALEFAYEGDYDSVEASLADGETAFERNRELHELALAGIEPIIAAARAQNSAIHAPELEASASPSEQDGILAGERVGHGI
ncbi:MAG: hypothetical protein JSS14_14765 [Proteobacteria bacterium]|nr:hypothetical protein [Pseudomonadota bacterium]